MSTPNGTASHTRSRHPADAAHAEGFESITRDSPNAGIFRGSGSVA